MAAEQDRKLLRRIESLSPEQRRLLAKRTRERVQQALELRPEAREPAARLPLTPGQRRLWQEHQAAPATPIHVVCQALHLDGALDAERLEAALAAVVRRHEALRTTFEVVDGEPRQRVRPDLEVPLERLDLDADAIERRAAEQSWRAFDLAAGPLLRWTLARLAPERHALLVTVHNLVFDAWSFSVFLDELIALYNRRDLEAPRLQFLDFAAWQRRWLGSDEARRQMEGWRRQLAPPLPPAFPTDRPRGEGGHRRGRRLSFNLPAAVKEGLAHLGRREGATLFMVLAALVQVFVRRRTGSDDVVIGTFNANRARPGTAGIVGYLLNVVPLRTDLSGDPDFASAVRRVRKVALGAQASADLPWERLVEELPRTGDGHRNPLFDILFIFENVPPAAESPEGLSLAAHDVDKGVARFDLTISLYDDAESLRGWLEYDTGLFEPASASAMVADLTRLAETAVARPKVRLSELGGA